MSDCPRMSDRPLTTDHPVTSDHQRILLAFHNFTVNYQCKVQLQYINSCVKGKETCHYALLCKCLPEVQTQSDTILWPNVTRTYYTYIDTEWMKENIFFYIMYYFAWQSYFTTGFLGIWTIYKYKYDGKQETIQIIRDNKAKVLKPNYLLDPVSAKSIK